MKVFKNALLKKFILYFILVISIGSDRASDSARVSLIDSSVLKFIRPDSVLEKKVFDDPKMKYDRDVQYEPGLLDRFMDWLSELLFGNNNNENIEFTRTLIIWAVIIFCVILVIWLLWRSDLSRLVRPESKLTTFNFNEITDDLSTINFDKMIDEALRNNDFRTAIRWNYLKCLFLLEKGGHLMFQPSKTNIDYLNDLRKSDFLSEFKAVSRIYDYVWYGKFTVDQSKYTELKREFSSFESHLNVQGEQ